MAWLKTYEWERETFSEFYEVRLCPDEAQAILKKLCRHFKVPYLRSRFRNGRGGGNYNPQLELITFRNYQPMLSTVIHEFAHHLESTRWNTGNWHGKKFKRELKRSYTFAKRYLPK